METRINYIDYLKCFAIWMVVWGHTVQSFGINSAINCYLNLNIILAFHMPLFAVLSGYLFSSKCTGIVFFTKKNKQLLLPYTFWCIIAYWLIPSLGDSVNYGEFVDSLFFKGWWFIRGLFLCFIFAFVLEKVFNKHNKNSISLIISVLVFLILGWSGIIPNMHSPMKDFFFLYPFFVFGIILKRSESWVQQNRLLIFVLSVVMFFVGSLFWKGWEDTFYQMNTSIFEVQGYENIIGLKVIERSLLRFVMGLSGSMIFIIAFHLFEIKINSLSFSSLLLNIGKNSIAVYFLQYFVFAYISPRNLFAYQIIVLPLCLLISISIVLCSYWIFYLTSKNKWLRLLLWGKSD